MKKRTIVIITILVILIIAPIVLLSKTIKASPGEACSGSPNRCRDYAYDQGACLSVGCDWIFMEIEWTCWGTPNACIDYISQGSCTFAGCTWTETPDMKINIGDVWKDAEEIKINIGDSWKTVYG